MIQDVIKTRVTGYAGVSAIIGTSYFWQWANEDSTLPYIVVTASQGQATLAQSRENGLLSEVFTFDCCSSSYAEARSLFYALRDCLSGYQDASTGGTIRLCELATWDDTAFPPAQGREFGIYCIQASYRIQYSQALPAL